MYPKLARHEHLVQTLVSVGVWAICVVLIRPFLESGLMDDWSYVRTAEILARTGHVSYNGWATAMLGWPLYLAALLVRLFGDSFAVVRSANLIVSALTVALLHRLFLRVGVNAWNASLATCVCAVSPIFLLASVTFLSDLPGLLAVLTSYYGCLRAIESKNHAPAWILFAIFCNVLLGTCRQIAWLGLVVVVPSAMWILRKDRRVLAAGFLSVPLGIALICAAVAWFNSQPYAVAEHISRSQFRKSSGEEFVAFLIRLLFEVVLFSIPIALAFAPALARIKRKQALVLVVAVTALIPLLRHEAKHYPYHQWLSPFFLFEPAAPVSIETMFTNTQIPIHGASPSPLNAPVRVVLTGVCLVALACSLAALVYARQRRAPLDSSRHSRQHLFTLVWPYCLAYVLLLLPRALSSFSYDRYCLLLLPPILLYTVRWYQDRFRERLPGYSLILIGLVAICSVLSLHDVFAGYRASLALIDEVRAEGVSRTEIDGGWEYNHYTELLTSGYVLQPGTRMPNGTIQGSINGTSAGPCSMDLPEWTPTVQPRFTMAYPGSHCAATSGFKPVHFRTWLPPFRRSAYVAYYVPQTRTR